jgi:hypothetical protein
VLESAVEVTVGDHPVAVVALTASENAQARFLTAAWAVGDDTPLAVVLALLQATSRTIARWIGNEATQDPGPHRHHHEHPAGASGSSPQRLSLVGFDVVPDSSGTRSLEVRLAGFGEAVNRRRSEEDGVDTTLSLGASVTLDAVHDLLTTRDSRGGPDRNLRDAGAYRLRTGQQDIVVVLAEAAIDGDKVWLAGATSADDGVERASIKAALQATNPLVAYHAHAWSPGALSGVRPAGLRRA